MRTSGFRDELFLKLLGAGRLGEGALAGLLPAQRRACLSGIGGLSRLRAQPRQANGSGGPYRRRTG